MCYNTKVMFLSVFEVVFMGSQLYKNLKFKFFITTAILMFILLMINIIGSYIFIINSNYEHINVHSDDLYNKVAGIISEDSVFENNRGLLKEFLNGYDIDKIYTLKKIDDDNIVYLDFAEKNFEDKQISMIGKAVDKDLFEKANSIFLEECDKISDEPGFFSDTGIIQYIYPIYGVNNKVIGAVGFDVDTSIVKDIADTSFTSVISNFVIITLVFFIILLFLFYNFINRVLLMIVYTDNLTKMQNRAAYEEKVDYLNSRLKENYDADKEKIYILIFDLNDLKFVNDNLGHLAGDEYIKSAGKIINDVFSDIGTTYRIGGDEFTSVVTKASNDSEVERKLGELEQRENEYNKEGKSFFMSISAGYDSFIGGQDMNLVSVLKRADEKMYRDKKLKKLRIKEQKENGGYGKELI